MGLCVELLWLRGMKNYVLREAGGRNNRHLFSHNAGGLEVQNPSASRLHVHRELWVLPLVIDGCLLAMSHMAFLHGEREREIWCLFLQEH